MARPSLLFVLVALLCGCGGSNGAQLHGPVTLNGQPIESGTLQFLPADGSGQPVGAEIKQGTYAVADVPVGKTTVMITALRETGEVIEEGGRKWPKLVSIVPAHYARGWEIEVQPGKHEQPIALTSSP